MGKYLSGDNSNWMEVDAWLEENKGKHVLFKHCDRTFFGKLEEFEKNTGSLNYREITFSNVYFVSGQAFIFSFFLNGERDFACIKEDNNNNWLLADYSIIANGKKITMKYLYEFFYCEEINKTILKAIDLRAARFRKMREEEHENES